MKHVTLKTPIKVIESKYYYLVIEDANGITHYFHNKHEDEKYGKFEQGEYDGWSKECKSKELC
jgi:hypothetical protein